MKKMKFESDQPLETRNSGFGEKSPWKKMSGLQIAKLDSISAMDLQTVVKNLK